MEAFMQGLLKVVQTVNLYLSDYILIVLLIGAGLYFTVRTRFVQVRCFGEGMKRVFGGLTLKGEKHGKSGMSSFQALATAIAAQVGTGNVVGACGAILIGGPGAIFWMWVIAFFGMATIYAEATLAQKTKVYTEEGEVLGGPVYYIRKAFKGGFGKFLAVFFSVAIILALGFMGGMVQSNSIGEACNTAFGIPTWVCGIVVAAVAGLIFLGGIQRIASVTEKVVPIMACLYIVGSLVLLCMNITRVPEAFGLIFKYAFKPTAIIGGGLGYALKTAISQGAKRGLFSNEAGMGSTPHAHAVAKVEKPHDQGVTAMIGVFIDTFIVLTLTALVVITAFYTTGGELANGYDAATSAVGVCVGVWRCDRKRFCGNLSAVFCLYHHRGLVFLWQAERRLSVRQKGGRSLHRYFASVRILGLDSLKRSRLGVDRHLQPTDGDPQRHGTHCTRRCRCGNRQGRGQGSLIYPPKNKSDCCILKCNGRFFTVRFVNAYENPKRHKNSHFLH